MKLSIGAAIGRIVAAVVFAVVMFPVQVILMYAGAALMGAGQ